MKIVGKLTARTLIYFGAAEMTFVILLCYALAVANHHVKPWLPTISACGDHPPEQYPFRFGIMLGAMLLLVEAVALHAAKLTSSLTYVLGAVAALCLGVVAVVAANEDNTVHTSKLRGFVPKMSCAFLNESGVGTVVQLQTLTCLYGLCSSGTGKS